MYLPIASEITFLQCIRYVYVSFAVWVLNERLDSECSSKDYIYIYKKGGSLEPLNLTLNIAVIDIRLIKAGCNHYGPQ